MPVVVLDILKYLFLLLLFLFLARAVKAMYLEISGPRRVPGAPRQTTASVKAGKPPESVVIVDPEGKTRSFEITDELIVGRSSKCHVVITDTFASQVHSRIFRRGEAVMIEDMGSTNGTFLNRRKVSAALGVNRGDTARIGKTQLEFRK